MSSQPLNTKWAARWGIVFSKMIGTSRNLLVMDFACKLMLNTWQSI